MGLEELNILSVGGGGNGNHEVVHVGEDGSFIDRWVKRGDVYDKEKQGDGGALGGTEGDWGEDLRASPERGGGTVCW